MPYLAVILALFAGYFYGLSQGQECKKCWCCVECDDHEAVGGRVNVVAGTPEVEV